MFFGFNLAAGVFIILLCMVLALAAFCAVVYFVGKGILAAIRHYRQYRLQQAGNS